MRNFHLAGRSTVHAQNAMVATSHPLAALTAIEVMRSGGTAADAAVAACALLGVIEPQSTGIGGDCFALVQPRGEGKITAYNGSGRAPQAATAEWYLDRDMHSIPLTSAHAVSIPGAVDAWTTILRDHGKLGLDTLLQPAIKAAEEGYVVTPRTAFDWKNQFEKLKNGTNTGRYLLPHGKPAVAGDVIHQRELGKTLRAIASDGRDAFYKDAIAEDMVETLRGIGGLHTLDETLAAARYENIQVLGHAAEHEADCGAIGGGHELHTLCRERCAVQPRDKTGVDGAVRVQALGSAAQDDDVARLQAERARIRRHIRPAFVNHADDTQRDDDALNE